MGIFRRSLAALGIAAMLPTIVFAAVGVFYMLRVERERIEEATLAQTRAVVALVDSRLQRDLAVLDALATAATLDIGDRAEFYSRSERVLRSNPEWARILLIDAASTQAIVRVPGGAEKPKPIEERHLQTVAEVVSRAAAQIGSVERANEPVVWIYAPVQRASKVSCVLAAAIRTDVFQNILLASAPAGSTAAIVDASGNFIARTLHYEKRVGTPATIYVRTAISQGMRGFYPGVTHEGLKSYTAYHTSERSRWSAHIAVASSLIDIPTVWSVAVAGFAGIGSVLLAGVLIVLVLRDMAERRRADEALRQSQKMEAVGQLTGGIAHDFNNLLTAIIGNLDMIQTRVAGNERVQRLAANALEAARRGAKLAAQLLAFSRTQRMTVRCIDLQHVLGGMSGLLAQSVGPSIRVEVNIEEDARLVVSDANQLELALLNLAVNARDAMAGAGTLTISAKRAQRVDRSLPPGEYIDVRVSDTGAGMSDEVRAHAIEPFYTTKPTGQGTGLGLSQVYGVVRESGGALTINSEPGKGTTVCLTLRAGLPNAAPSLTRPGSRGALHTDISEADEQASVLIVDDDRLVRRFMTESLRSLGYSVTDTHDGASAIEILKQQAFDLLLVDFAMPGMNGAQVAAIARNMYPNLRILIVSGYADTNALESAIGAAPQLRKPFDLAELRAAVAEAMQTPA
jgi:signal transduction histidine kinase/CheY-like chemotaxis protein